MFDSVFRTVKGNHEVNEDYVVSVSVTLTPYSPEVKIGVVCDGMGGMAKARESARIAANTFVSELVHSLIEQCDFEVDYFDICKYRDRIVASVKNAIQKANEAVCALAVSGVQNGTTLSGVLIIGNYMVAINIGDSPIYCKHGDDWNLVSEINNEFANDFDEESKTVLTNYLGKYSQLDETMCHIYIEENMNAGKTGGILIMSDGLYEAMDDFYNIYDFLKNDLDYSKFNDDDKTVLLFEV